MLTRLFKSGNSMAVRIPKELAFLDPTVDVEIERVGNTLILRPVETKTLADVPAILASFSSDFMAGGREFHEQKERDWGGLPDGVDADAGSDQGQVVMSVVTYAELRAGLEMQSRNREHDERVLALLIERIPVLPFTQAAAGLLTAFRTGGRSRLSPRQPLRRRR